ncbi:hypothetical protein [Curtobacterium sp. MCBD17_040]|uniref:hypothetical protein n=1 Tax=Curtobacterium sp. MCBD17_040 TaxID=2175674 RepID=UPI0011B3FEAE|nr:hypothetical protein [Curtobacterium sp. MCBD17_040]WIB65902.1 hypothetical protein DEI94_17455 [Curtobacterium sp. MCBD17_040]
MSAIDPSELAQVLAAEPVLADAHLELTVVPGAERATRIAEAVAPFIKTASLRQLDRRGILDRLFNQPVFPELAFPTLSLREAQAVLAVIERHLTALDSAAR